MDTNPLTARTPQGFIFDLDGVIVNTVDLHYRAWKELFDELGVPFERAAMDRFRGIHQREILLSLIDGLDETQISLLLARKGSYYRQALVEAAPTLANAPVVSLLYAARARGIRVGLASSSINARLVLSLVGLLDVFDAIADGATVCRFKPAPDIFVWVAGALDLSPADAVVFEDGEAGIEAARTAGMYTVGLGAAAAACAPDLPLTMDMLSLDTVLTHYAQRAMRSAPTSHPK
jgi:beta-phosphoglucomutase